MTGTEAARLFATVDADTSGFQRGMKGVETSMKSAGNQSITAWGKIKDFAAGQIVGTYALQGMNAALSAVKSAFIGYNSTLEQTTVGFTSMLGSAEAAGKYIGELQAFARTTPFEFGQLVQTAQRMMAMGFAAEDVIPVLTDVGDAMAAMGKSGDAVDGVTYALSQMMASGRVNANDMLQMTSAGIPAWKYLAKSIGKSVAETRKLSEQGLIPAEVGLKAIREGMRADFGGLMAQQSRTFVGALSNIRDMSTQLVAGGLKPLFETLRDLMVAFADLLMSEKVAAVFADLAKGLTNFITKTKETVKGLDRFHAVVEPLEGALHDLSEILLHNLHLFMDIGKAFVKGLHPTEKFAEALARRLGGAMRGLKNATLTLHKVLHKTLIPVMNFVGKVINKLVIGNGKAQDQFQQTAFIVEKVVLAFLAWKVAMELWHLYKKTVKAVNDIAGAYNRTKTAIKGAYDYAMKYSLDKALPSGSLSFKVDTTGMANQGAGMIDSLAKGAMNALPGFAMVLGPHLSKAATALAPLLSNPYVAVGAAIVAAILAPILAPEFFGELLGSLLAAIVNLAVALPGAVVDVFVGIGTAIVTAVSDTLKGVWGGVQKIFSGDILGGLWDIVSSLVSFIPRIFGGIISAVWEAIVGIWNTVFDFSGMLAWIGERLSLFAKTFWDTFTSKLSDSAKGVFKAIGDIGKGIVDFLGKAIQAGIATLINMLIIKPVNALIWAYNAIPILGDLEFLKEIPMPSFKTGGIVPGLDSQAVPIMAHGGEAVLPAKLTDALMNGSAGRGGNVITVNANFGADSVRDDKDVKKIVGLLDRQLRLAGAFGSVSANGVG
jgi:tape measure domain-containing protein